MGLSVRGPTRYGFGGVQVNLAGRNPATGESRDDRYVSLQRLLQVVSQDREWRVQAVHEVVVGLSRSGARE